MISKEPLNKLSINNEINEILKTEPYWNNYNGINEYKILSDIDGLSQGVILYGAGRIGKCLHDIICEYGFSVLFFIDKSKNLDDNYMGTPVYDIEEFKEIENYKNITVIISACLSNTEGNKVKNELMKYGFNNIVFSQKLLTCFYAFSVNQKSYVDFVQCRNEVINVYNLLEDDISRKIFIENVKAYMTWNFDSTIENFEMTQYVDVNINFTKGYSHFVDCGAYIGDTFKELIKRYTCNRYIGFEPDIYNFNKLSETISECKSKFNEAYIYPCAVSNKTGYTCFSQVGNSNSKLSIESKNGVPVSTVKLDDILKNVKITMIKMDIEGAEIDALQGAERIIKEQEPDLAICVYHKISDIWTIPILLKKLVPQYRFYLRSHSFNTMETVLYATI